MWSNFLQGMGDAWSNTAADDAGPGWKTGAFLGLFGQALGARAPVGVSLGGDADAALSSTARRSIRSLERQIEEHTQKLENYRANPDAFDNLGKLKNASPEVREKIINGRIRKLEGEIRKFQNEIDKLRNPNMA